jgi:alpha-1,3/alpha-1,6-mannosyltransferase
VDGMTGWLRSPADVEAWTAVMDMVLHKMSDAQLQKMAEAGRQRVVSEFSDVKMAERLQTIIDKISAQPVQSSARLNLVLAMLSLIPLMGLLAIISLWKLFRS